MEAFPEIVLTCGCVFLGTILLRRRWPLQGYGYANLSRYSKLFIALAVAVNLALGPYLVGEAETKGPVEVRRLVPATEAVKDERELIFSTRYFGYLARRKLSAIRNIPENAKSFNVRYKDKVKGEYIEKHMELADIRKYRKEHDWTKCLSEAHIKISVPGDLNKQNTENEHGVKHRASWMKAQIYMNESEYDVKSSPCFKNSRWDMYLGIQRGQYEIAAKLQRKDNKVRIHWKKLNREELTTLEELDKKVRDYCKPFLEESLKWFNPIMKQWEQIGAAQLEDEKRVLLHVRSNKDWIKKDRQLEAYVQAHKNLAETGLHDRASSIRRFEVENAGNPWFRKCPLASYFQPMKVDKDGLFLMCPEMQQYEEHR